jgi:hypothetical protein
MAPARAHEKIPFRIHDSDCSLHGSALELGRTRRGASPFLDSVSGPI